MANRRFIDFPIAASVGDNDIVLIWQDGLNKQTTKATLLQGSPQSLAGLTDVDIAGLTNGQILQYNSTLGKWENVDRTDINLSELGDVTIVAPTNGQVLVYNSSTSKWENSSGGYVPYTGAVTTVNLGAQSILAGSFVKAGGTSAQFLKADGSVDSTAYGTGSVTSVGLTMPSAFSVANSPVTTAGTLAVTATGTTAQYIRGDGSLATFPGLTGFVPYTGATADVNLGTHDLAAERGTFANNGSSDTLTVNHTSGSGYGIIVTKGGANEALYVSKTSGSGNAMTVVGGRTSLVDLALSSVTNTAGDFLTLSGGVVHKRTAAEVRTDIGAGTGNGTVTSVAALTLGTSGTDLSSTVANGTTTPVITLNVPTASATNRGALSAADWTTFNSKQNALTNPVTGTGTTNYLAKFTGSTTIGNSQVFDNGTNVGIGTASPFWKLTIANDVTSSDDGQLMLIGTTSSAKRFSIGYNTTSNFGFMQAYQNGVGYNNLIINPNGGNLLVGTTTDAGFRLDVNGTGRVSGVLTTNSGTNSTNGIQIISSLSSSLFTGGIEFIRTTVAGGSKVQPLRDATIGGVGLSFQVTANNTAEVNATYTSAMTILNSGNVGIGTSSPTTYSLSGTHVENFGGSTFAFIHNNTTTVKSFYATNESAGLSVLYTFSNHPLVFGTNNTERMRITSGGNVLIGTTTDVGAKLYVNGYTKSTGYAFNAFSGGTEWQIGSDAVTGSGLYIYNTGGGYSMILATSGAATFLNLGTGLVYSNGGTLTSTNPSDFNLKENIAPINYGLNEILKLNPVTFDWKKDTINQGKQYGFIAQEVQKIMPDLVKQGEYLGLDKEAIFTTLVKAIQELKQEIDTLKN
jgi:hypothetical protein